MTEQPEQSEQRPVKHSKQDKGNQNNNPVRIDENENEKEKEQVNEKPKTVKAVKAAKTTLGPLELIPAGVRWADVEDSDESNSAQPSPLAAESVAPFPNKRSYIRRTREEQEEQEEKERPNRFSHSMKNQDWRARTFPAFSSPLEQACFENRYPPSLIQLGDRVEIANEGVGTVIGFSSNDPSTIYQVQFDKKMQQPLAPVLASLLLNQSENQKKKRENKRNEGKKKEKEKEKEKETKIVVPQLKVEDFAKEAIVRHFPLSRLQHPFLHQGGLYKIALKDIVRIKWANLVFRHVFNISAHYTDLVAVCCLEGKANEKEWKQYERDEEVTAYQLSSILRDGKERDTAQMQCFYEKFYGFTNLYDTPDPSDKFLNKKAFYFNSQDEKELESTSLELANCRYKKGKCAPFVKDLICGHVTEQKGKGWRYVDWMHASPAFHLLWQLVMGFGAVPDETLQPKEFQNVLEQLYDPSPNQRKWPHLYQALATLILYNKDIPQAWSDSASQMQFQKQLVDNLSWML